MEELYKNIVSAAGQKDADWLINKLTEVAKSDPKKIKSLIFLAKVNLK